MVSLSSNMDTVWAGRKGRKYNTPHYTGKPPIKDTPKPPNKGQTKSTLTSYKLSPKEDNLSTKDKMLGPKHVLYTGVPPVLYLFVPV